VPALLLAAPTSSKGQARLDLILVRGRAHVQHVFRTGETEHDKPPSGLWPSAHAGVVSTVDFRP